MAALVKVLEVERVVPDLIDVGSSVVRFADLEFDGEDGGAGDQDSIEAAANAGHDELEEEGAVHADESGLQDQDLKQPGIPLGGLHREAAVRSQRADDFFRRRRQQLSDVCGVVGVRRLDRHRGDYHAD